MSITEIFKELHLNKVRRNQLYDLFNKHQIPLNLVDCVLEKKSSEIISGMTIRYIKDKRISFRLDANINTENNYWYKGYPMGNEKSDNLKVSSVTWKKIVTLFDHWLSLFKIEISEIEKWEYLTLQNEFIEFKIEDDKSKFTKDEQNQIDSHLDELKSRIKKLELAEEFKVDFQNEIEKLKDKNKYLSKTNWKQIFVGTIVNTIARFVLPKEKINLIWLTIKEVLSNLLIG